MNYIYEKGMLRVYGLPCPTCGLVGWDGYICTGCRWLETYATPTNIDEDALFDARLDAHAHLFWVCEVCGEVVS